MRRGRVLQGWGTSVKCTAVEARDIGAWQVCRIYPHRKIMSQLSALQKSQLPLLLRHCAICGHSCKGMRCYQISFRCLLNSTVRKVSSSNLDPVSNCNGNLEWIAFQLTQVVFFWACVVHIQSCRLVFSVFTCQFSVVRGTDLLTTGRKRGALGICYTKFFFQIKPKFMHF